MVNKTLPIIPRRLRSYLSALGFFAVLFFIILITPAYQSCMNGTPENYQNQAIQKEKTPTPVPSSVPECVDVSIQTYGTEITLASAFAVALFTFTLWSSTEGLRELAIKQANDMRESLAIAKESADTAKTALEYTQSESRIRLRAYVTVPHLRVTPCVSADKKLESVSVSAHVINVGETPAHINCVYVVPTLVPYEYHPPLDHFRERPQGYTLIVLGRGTDHHYGRAKIDREHLVAIHKKLNRGYVLIYIRYYDVFREEQVIETAFDLRMNVSPDVFEGAGKNWENAKDIDGVFNAPVVDRYGDVSWLHPKADAREETKER